MTVTIALLASMLHLAGCSAPCQAGVIVNLDAESGLDPSIVTRSGVGLAQWSGVRRRRLLATYAGRWADARNQIAVIIAEATGSGLWPRMVAMTDPGQAAVLFAREFERPRNRDYSGRARRAWELYRVLLSTTEMVTK